MEPVLFESGIISLACISDTHNDIAADHIPEADILLHAGDMTDHGTYDEFKRAYDWISDLPHKIKVVIAGNRDPGLDKTHPSYSEDALSLFTSLDAQKAGIYYLDRETQEVARFRAHDGSIRSLRVYGNPCQPDFLGAKDGFRYEPHPDISAINAWRTAPVGPEQSDADIWLVHSPPRGHLEGGTRSPWIGCDISAKCIARARPLLALFGHHHSGYGIKKVTWDLMEDKVNLSEQDFDGIKGQEIDLSASEMLDKDLNTLFVNAAYMTVQKSKVEKRNMPWLVRINFDAGKI